MFHVAGTLNAYQKKTRGSNERGPWLHCVTNDSSEWGPYFLNFVLSKVYFAFKYTPRKDGESAGGPAGAKQKAAGKRPGGLSAIKQKYQHL